MRGYASRGDAYESKNEHEKAVADYTEAIRLDPKLRDPYWGRANAYSKMGEESKAQADFAQAKKLGYQENSAAPWAM